MDATRFNAVAKLFARRRAQGAPGHQAQDPDVAPPLAETGPTMLFLQAFKAGSVASKTRADGRYTLTLEQGLGHTVYFSDRPHRVVGTTPTPEFLDGLGFPADNPPNAALVLEGVDGATEIAVLALYAPAYDEASRTATYEAEVLQGWQRSVQEGFVEADADLAARLPSFGAAHLFIDDCPGGTISCHIGAQWEGPVMQSVGGFGSADFGGFCYSGSANMCLPCSPWYPNLWEAEAYWKGQCNLKFPACNGECSVFA